MDVSIKDSNGFALNFSLQMAYNAKYLNHAYIKSFSNILSANLAQCAKPRYFKMNAFYYVPEKYWTINPELVCPYTNYDPFTHVFNAYEITILIIGEIKN